MSTDQGRPRPEAKRPAPALHLPIRGCHRNLSAAGQMGCAGA